jgi:soluble lytic murein transglycosylase-like protein
MRLVSLRACFLAVALATVLPSPVFGQIYSWRDPSGNLVLSNDRKDAAAQTYAVATTGSGQYRTTRKILNPRAAAFEPLIAEHAAANRVHPDLVRAVIQAESAFDPRARSHKGAMGLMQLMPATAAEYNVLDAFDPAENIRAGVAYLRSLLTRFSNNVELALAAYNAGPGAVKKYGDKVPPYRETRDYVAKIKASAPAVRPPTRVYKSTEVVEGREVTRLSNAPNKAKNK